MKNEFPNKLTLKSQRERRHVLKATAHQITMIKDAYEQNLVSVPENQSGTKIREVAEEAISVLDEMISMQAAVYPCDVSLSQVKLVSENSKNGGVI